MFSWHVCDKDLFFIFLHVCFVLSPVCLSANVSISLFKQPFKRRYVFAVASVCVRAHLCVHARSAWQDSAVKVSAMSSGMTGNNEPSQVQ